jgi:hypothetical protein
MLALMVTTNRLEWGGIVFRAIAAGLVGALFLELYLWLTTVLPAHASAIGAWQWIASTTIGKAAFSSPSYAALGLAIHVAVSIVWAGGYAYFAATRPSTNAHWLVAGASYGLVVYVLMQIILLAGGNFIYPANPTIFLNGVVADVVFFGVPVAYVVRALQPPA